MFHAARCGDVEALLAEIEAQPASVLAVEPNSGDSLLHAAAECGSVDACRLLLSKGAPVNGFNNKGVTALFTAVRVGAGPVAEVLIEEGGADLNAFGAPTVPEPALQAGQQISLDALARAPIHAAILSGDAGLVEYLVTRGAALDVAGSMGFTPLHFACVLDMEDLVMDLINHGAPVHARDDAGRAPADVAPAELASLLSRLQGGGGGGGGGGVAAPTPSKPTAPAAPAAGAADGGDGEDEGGEFDEDERQLHGDPARMLAGDGSGIELTESEAAGPADAETVAAAPPLLRNVFGEDVLALLLSKNWKLREEAVLKADMLISSWADGARRRGIDAGTLFEACCGLLSMAVNDKTPQVFAASVGMLKTVFSGANGAVRVPVTRRSGTLAVSGDDEDDPLDAVDPALDELLGALVNKAGGSSERAAVEAFQVLLFLASNTQVGPLPISRRLLVQSKKKSAKWRPILARLKLLERFLMEFQLSPTAGLTVEAVMKVAVPQLESASVKVRQAAIGVIARLAPLAMAVPGMPPTVDGVIAKLQAEFMGNLKLAVVKSVEAKMRAAIQAAEEGQAFEEYGASSPSAKKKSSKPKSSTKPPKPEGMLSPTPPAGAASGRKRPTGAITSAAAAPQTVLSAAAAAPGATAGSDDEGDDTNGELPYAEPLTEAVREHAAPVSMCFGQDVARCAFSHDWRPRAAALARIMKTIDTSVASLSAALSGSEDAGDPAAIVGSLVGYVTAARGVMCLGLEDKVLRVYLRAIRLLEAVAQAIHAIATVGRGITVPPTANMISGIRSALNSAVAHLGDSKPKTRQRTSEVLLAIANLRTFGCRFMASIILDAEEAGSADAEARRKQSSALVTGRLGLLHELVDKTGVAVAPGPEESDARLPLARLLAVAEVALQDREVAAREAATRLFYLVSKIADAQGFSSAVAAKITQLEPSMRQRLQSRMVDLANSDVSLAAQPAPTVSAMTGGTRAAGPAPVAVGADADDFFSWHPSNPQRNALLAPSPVTVPMAAEEGSAGAAAFKLPDRPTTASNRAQLRSRGGLYSALGGAAERAAKSERLPYASPIPAETLPEVAAMVEVFGDALIRCLVSKTWSVREAALRQAERHLLLAAAPEPAPDDTAAAERRQAVLQGGGNPLSRGSPQVLMQASSMVERALRDTVAKIFETGVTLLLSMVREYLPGVSGREFLVRAALQPAVRAVVERTGDSKERLRAVSMDALLALCKLPALPASLVGETVLEAIREQQLKIAGMQLVGLLGILTRLVDELGIGSATSGVSVEDVIELLLPLFENRNVDVRGAAVEVYAAVFRAIARDGGSVAPLRAVVADLKPALRTAIQDAVQGVAVEGEERGNSLANAGVAGLASPTRGTAGAPRLTSGSSSSNVLAGAAAGSDDGSRMLASEQESVRQVFGDAIAAKLQAAGWVDRRSGLWEVAEKLGQGLSIPSAAGAAGGKTLSSNQQQLQSKAWETCTRILKAALMDPCPQLNVAALDVLQALTDQGPVSIVGLSIGNAITHSNSSKALNKPATTTKVTIPWDAWEARLALGSLVKTVVDRTASPHVRVRDSAAIMAGLVARANPVGYSLVCRHVLAPVEVAQVSATPTATELGTLRNCIRTFAARLRCLKELQDMAAASDADATALPLDGVLGFCAKALGCSSSLVRNLATSCAISAARQAASAGTAGVQAVRAFVTAADAKTRTKLQPVLTSLLSGSDEEPPGKVSVGGASAAATPAEDLGIDLAQYQFGAMKALENFNASRGSVRSASSVTVDFSGRPESGFSAGGRTPMAGRRAARPMGVDVSAASTGPIAASAMSPFGSTAAEGGDSGPTTPLGTYSPSFMSVTDGAGRPGRRQTSSRDMHPTPPTSVSSSTGPTAPGFSPIRGDRPTAAAASFSSSGPVAGSGPGMASIIPPGRRPSPLTSTLLSENEFAAASTLTPTERPPLSSRTSSGRGGAMFSSKDQDAALPAHPRVPANLAAGEPVAGGGTAGLLRSRRLQNS